MRRFQAILGLTFLLAALWLPPTLAVDIEWDGVTLQPGGTNGVLGDGFYPTLPPASPDRSNDPLSPSGNQVVIRDRTPVGPSDVAGNVYGGADVVTYYPNAVNSTNNTVTFITDNPANEVNLVPQGGSPTPPAPAGTGSVFGGFSTHGNAMSNGVVFDASYGGTIAGSVYGGYAGLHDHDLVVSASYNTITIATGSTVSIGGSVTGGLSFGGDTLYNTIIMAGGRAASVQGGRNDGTGNAIGNEVALSGAATVITGGVHGGLAGVGSASSNIVTVAGGTFGSVVGGESRGDGAADDNHVTATNATVNGTVHGGLTAGGAVTGNLVDIQGGTAGNGAAAVYGGQSIGAGAATGNIVSVDGAALQGDAFGGWSATGAATDNIVFLANSSVSNVLGGHSGNGGDVIHNTVTIQSSGVTGYVVGGDTATGAAERNTVLITNSGVGSFVYGGFVSGLTASSAITGNTVTFAGRTGTDVIGGNVAGGYTLGSGAVTDNSVTHQGGTISGDVYGGYGGAGAVSANSVQVSGDAAVTGSVYGGYNAGRTTTTGAVTNNQVSVSTSGTIGGAVIGGRTAALPIASSGDVANNTVTLSGSGSVGIFTISGYNVSAVGGIAEGTGAVRANAAAISDGDFDGIVAGGMSFNSGAVSANGLQVSGGAVAGNAYGGFSSGAGNVSSNTAAVSGTADFAQNLYGGYATGGNATTNSVTMGGGSVAGSVAAGRSFSGNANQNTPALGGGNVAGSVHGGFTEGGTGSANANRVTLSGAIVGGDAYGGRSASGNANDNTVVMTNGSVDGIYGGSTGGATANQSASGNTVTLTGGSGVGPQVTGNVYGGFGGANALTNRNRVNVSGTIDFNGSAVIRGGSNSDITGNILTTHGRDYTVGTVGNFETYNFTLSRDYVDETVYTVSIPVAIGGSTVNIVFNSGGSPLNEGDVITLFSDSDGVLPTLGSTLVPNGALFDQEIGLAIGQAPAWAGQDTIDVVVLSTRAADETQLLGQAQLAALTMLNVASDLHREVAGMIAASEACQAAGVTDDCRIYLDCNRPVVFAGVSGGSSTFDTGGNSEITVDHGSFLGGVGYRTGSTLMAAFFETGWGQFDAKLNSRTFNDNDSLSYAGGGLLVRYERGGFYAEGSMHAGRSKTSFNTAVRLAVVDYESKATYYGADAVLGYRFRFPCSTLDLSLRYGWNRSKGDTVMVGANAVDLDAVDSHRLRGRPVDGCPDPGAEPVRRPRRRL
ncbi:MAG: hypothetical protein LUE17_14535 [Planctomycetaceae bacterium]|nr:hypothetical protein [Planctomycetaceae bacterium]